MFRLLTGLIGLTSFWLSALVFAHAVAITRPVVTLTAINAGSSHNKAVIVIDAGHGGKDPGASGPQHTHEKNVVLALSQDLRDSLAHYAGISVILTRNNDYFVTLRGRLLAARQHHADIFVAIHADSYLNQSAHGASVFALSEHGASSEAARWLARNENTAVLGGVEFHDNSRMVQSVLLDLSQTATTEDSLHLGKKIIRSLAKITHLHTGFVEQAPFMVLKSPDIPSVLVETGFISNGDEEAHLKSSSYQHQIADAIAAGIVAYLYQNPPQHSLIATQQAGKLSIILTQDQSINTLAAAYNVSASKLRTINHAPFASYFVKGRKVMIPAS